MNKQTILKAIIDKLEADIIVAEQAVTVARDTATHKDCLGSSKYETMGTEASYLAKGQGERLLELQRALAYFKQLKPSQSTTIQLSSLVTLEDDKGVQQLLWLAADAGGLKISYNNQTITVITLKSPLGKILLGKVEADTFELTVAGTILCYEIISIV